VWNDERLGVPEAWRWLGCSAEQIVELCGEPAGIDRVEHAGNGGRTH
jgi:hypothetical protein